MNGALRAVGFVTSFVMLVGCQGIIPPQQHKFNDTRTYDQSFEGTWDHLHNYLDAHGFQVDFEERETGVLIASLPQDDRFADFADCGWQYYQRRVLNLSSLEWEPQMVGGKRYSGDLTVFVAPEGPRTTVTVSTTFLVAHAPPTRGGPIPAIWGSCTSTGILEGEVLNSL